MLRLYSGDVEADDQFLIDHAEYALQADRPLMAADMDAGNWPHKVGDACPEAATAGRSRRVKNRVALAHEQQGAKGDRV